MVLNGPKSGTVDPTSGVPQGSVHGPLLFLNYINDITLGLRSDIGLDADDCVIYQENITESDIDILQGDIDMILFVVCEMEMENVFECGQVQLHVLLKKVQIVQSEYLLSGTLLAVVTETKYLSVVFE